MNCIINGLTDEHRSIYETPYSVQKWLTDKGIKSTKSRRAKLKNRRVQQLVTTLAAFDSVDGLTSPESKARLALLSGSLKERSRSYGAQNGFVSYLSFLAKVIDTVK